MKHSTFGWLAFLLQHVIAVSADGFTPRHSLGSRDVLSKCPAPKRARLEGHVALSRTHAQSSGQKHSASGSHLRGHAKALAARADEEGDEPMTDSSTRASSASSGTPEHDPNTLLPPLTEAEYKAQVKKGQQLYEWMGVPTIPLLDQAMRKAGRLSQGQSSQSAFQDSDDLAEGGWRDQEEENKGELDDPAICFPAPVEPVLRALGASTRSSESGGLNAVATVIQNDNYFDGVEHEYATDAMLVAAYNTEQGILISTSAISPRARFPEHLEELAEEEEGLSHQKIRDLVQDPKNYPRLQRPSDIHFLRYLAAAEGSNDDVKRLRYMIGLAIYQSDTVLMLDYILKSKGTEADPWTTTLRHSGQYRVPQWPETLVFSPRDKDPSNFYALVNRMNSKVWLLLQHRKHLGVKRISKLTFFHGPVEPNSRAYVGASVLIELENLDTKGGVVPWPKGGLNELPGAQAGSSRAQAGSSSGRGRRRGLSRL